MIKVSFKLPLDEKPKTVTTFNDRVVKVTLKGKLIIPVEIRDMMNLSIWKWMDNHPSVYSIFDMIIVDGIAKCSDTDTFNHILGERIAEARAKIKLYRFISTLIEKIMKNTFKIMYGNMELDVCRESHENPPLPCLLLEYRRYLALEVSEQKHLNELIENS